MSERPAPEPSDALPGDAFAEASAWLFRLRADDAGAADREAFRRWLARGPQQAEAWTAAQALFERLDAPARSIAAERQRRPAPAPRRRLPRRRLPSLALGAALALLLVVAWWRGPLWLDRLGADHATGFGERARITLADGSLVELNSDSALDEDFTAGQRRVTLRRGEAFFDVTGDAARPFVVACDGGEVRVTGTQFSVRDAQDALIVTVAEGSVLVTGDAAATSPVTLTAGQRVVVTDGRPQPIEAADPAAALAWRQGQAVFRQQTLAEVVETLNRSWDSQIVIVTGATAARRVSGVFEIDRPEAVLAALRDGLGLEVVDLGGYVILLY